jgi:hypothetical protein
LLLCRQSQWGGSSCSCWGLPWLSGGGVSIAGKPQRGLGICLPPCVMRTPPLAALLLDLFAALLARPRLSGAVGIG